jgi:hypothetical protein
LTTKKKQKGICFGFFGELERLLSKKGIWEKDVEYG